MRCLRVLEFKSFELRLLHLVAQHTVLNLNIHLQRSTFNMEAPSTNVQVASNNNQSTNDKQTALDIISETFPPFDHRGKIVAPFDNETKRDAEFQESELRA